jgi:hypothetical protein
MTPALRWGVGGQHHAPAALPPGKTRYPLYRSLRRPQGRSVRVRKISPNDVLTEYCSGDKIEDETSGTCSAYGEEERRIHGFGGET